MNKIKVSIVVLLLLILLVVIIYPSQKDTVGNAFGPPSCTFYANDTDNGNIFTKGIASYPECISLSFTDRCISPCILVEYINRTSFNANCTYGCVDGACLSSPVNQRQYDFCTRYFNSQSNNSNTSNKKPIVTITSPTNNQLFYEGSDIKITADASDDGQIKNVEFYRGSILLGSDAVAPYEFDWLNVTRGNRTLRAVAYDDMNVNTTSASVSITVVESLCGNTVCDSGEDFTTCPLDCSTLSINITNPKEGAIYTKGDDILITAEVTSGNNIISSVAFYNKNIFLGNDISYPYDFTITNASKGNYSLQAVVFDDKTTNATSDIVHVQVYPISFCGDGICEIRENYTSCPEDCSLSTFCGDGTCNGNEDSNTCAIDCPPLASGYEVTFSDAACSVSNGFCKDFSLTCDGALSGQTIYETGSVIVNDPIGTPVGTVIFVTGGGGTVPYHEDSPKQSETVNYMLSQNYRVVEINWSSNAGIIDYPSNVGAVNLFCAPAAVFKEFLDTYGIAGPVCGQGNSGGSMQYAYGLSFYGLENYFDTIILTGGPPSASFPEGCQGYPRSPYGFMPGKALGPSFVDDISGYGASAPPSQQLCTSAWRQQIDIYNYQTFVSMIDNESLAYNHGLERNPRGDYDFPNTNVFFVESANDDSNANNIGKLYYNIVNPKQKSIVEISGVGYPNGGHNVPSTVEGAEQIRTLLTTYCR